MIILDNNMHKYLHYFNFTCSGGLYQEMLKKKILLWF